MASNRQEIDLIVSAITKGFDKVAADIGKAEKATKQAGDEAKSSSMKWTELKSKVDLAGQVFNKVAQAAKFTYEALSQGAELNAAQGRFENLTSVINTTADSLLTKMQAATKGMVSDAELIAGASDIISLGLAKTEEDTVRLATSVSTLGLDMQQVILTFANNSKARLDSLGLSVEGVTQKAAELEAQGFVGDAFDEAVLIGLEEKMALLGDASETTAGQLKILESSWENVTNAAKQFFALKMAPTISGLSSTVNALNEDVAAGRGGWDNFKIILGETGKAMSSNDVIWQNMIDTAKEGDEQVLRQISHLQRQAEEQASVTAAIEATLAAQESETSALTESMRARSEAAAATGEFTDKQLQAAAAQQNYEERLREGIVVSGHAAAATGELANKTDEQIAADEAAAAAAAEHAASLGDLFRAAIESKDGIGLFNETAAEMADRSIYVSNLTRDQRDALSDLQSEYDKAQDVIDDYTIGVKGVGMETEAVNEKVAEQQERMGQLQAAMEPLLGVGGEYASVQGTMTINQDALNQSIFDAADAQGASAEQLAVLGGALGLYSDEAVEAALQSALIRAKIDEMTAAFLAGEISVDDIRTGVNDFVASLQAVPGAVTTDVSVNGIDDAIAKVGSLQQQLNNLGNQVSAADAAGATQKNGGVGLAHGADFVVPPGFPNDSFGPLFVQSGERVQVTPSGQTSNSTINAPITINAPGGNPQDIQTAVTDGLLRAMRTRGL